MAQGNNNQWPKAIVATIGTVAVIGAAYLMREPQLLWGFVGVIWLTSFFD